jgi:hypothetical protein
LHKLSTVSAVEVVTDSIVDAFDHDVVAHYSQADGGGLISIVLLSFLSQQLEFLLLGSSLAAIDIVPQTLV